MSYEPESIDAIILPAQYWNRGILKEPWQRLMLAVLLEAIQSYESNYASTVRSPISRPSNISTRSAEKLNISVRKSSNCKMSRRQASAKKLSSSRSDANSEYSDH